MSKTTYDVYDLHQHVGPLGGLLGSEGWFLEDDDALRADVEQRLAFYG